MSGLTIAFLLGLLIGCFRVQLWHGLEWCVVKIRERKK